MRKKQKKNNISSVLSVFSTAVILFSLFIIIVAKHSKYDQEQAPRFEKIEEPVITFAEIDVTDQILNDVEIDVKELSCLQKALFWEVRKDNETEMLAVASVINNRLNDRRYPSTICQVVKQSGQFEYVMRGLHDKKKVIEKINENNIEMNSWLKAGHIAKKVLSVGVKDVTDGAIAFHANSMEKPKSKFWKKLKSSKKYTLHTYYKE